MKKNGKSIYITRVLKCIIRDFYRKEFKTYRFSIYGLISAALILYIFSASSISKYTNDEMFLSEGSSGISTNILTDQLDEVFDQNAGKKMTSSGLQNSTFPRDPQYFGAYVVKPIGDDLYVGISGGLPAMSGGALLTKYSNGSLVPILNADGSNRIDEDGMHEIVFDGKQFYIPGSDPSDNHMAGNLYTYIPGQDIVKHRFVESTGSATTQAILPNVLHSWSVLVEGDTIYVGTGAYEGEPVESTNVTPVTFAGRLYKGNSFSAPFTYSTYSNYRLWSMVRFKGDLYASGLETDSGGWQTPTFRVSKDSGQSWQSTGTTSGDSPYYRTRLVEINGMLVNKLASAGDMMWFFNGTDTPTKVSLPRGYFTFDDYAMNAMAVDRRGYLYLLAKKATDISNLTINRKDILLRTKDLQNWELVAELNQKALSLAYWQAKDQLVVGIMGSGARLEIIQLADQLDLPEITPLPTPTPVPIATPTPTPTPIPISAFAPSKDGKIEYGTADHVVLANPDGTNNIIYLRGEEIAPYSYISDANLSMDGTMLVFVAAKNNGANYMKEWNFKIMTKSFPSGVIEEWLPDQPKGAIITYPHLSPDNQEIYFSMVKPAAEQAVYGNYSGIFKVRKGERQPIEIIPYPQGGKYQFRDISSDGTKLLFNYHSDASVLEYFDIYTSSTDGTNRNNLTNSMNVKKLNPSFSADGRVVMYQEINPANSTYDIAVIDVQTKTKRFLNPTADYDERYSCFSPDSRKIIYHASSKQSPYQSNFLYRSNSDGTNPVKIFNVTNNEAPRMHCWANDPLYIPPTPVATPTPQPTPTLLPDIVPGVPLPFPLATIKVNPVFNPSPKPTPKLILKPVPSPILMQAPSLNPANRPPVITTSSLPGAKRLTKYTAVIEGLDYDLKDVLKMQVTGLPTFTSFKMPGLMPAFTTSCRNTYTAKDSKIACTIQGRTLQTGTYTVTATLTDSKGLSATRAYTLRVE